MTWSTTDISLLVLILIVVIAIIVVLCIPSKDFNVNTSKVSESGKEGEWKHGTITSETKISTASSLHAPVSTNTQPNNMSFVVIDMRSNPKQSISQEVAAVQYQLTRHFGPAYKMKCDIREDTSISGRIPVFIVDSVSCPYKHTGIHLINGHYENGSVSPNYPSPPMTIPIGSPYIILDMSEITKYDIPLSFVMSHEVLETAANPSASRLQENMENIFKGKLVNTTTLWYYEICDPVTDTGYYVTIGDANIKDSGSTTNTKLVVSNFVLPAWFDTVTKNQKYDYLGILSKPATVTEGGYMGKFDVDINAVEIVGNTDITQYPINVYDLS